MKFSSFENEISDFSRAFPTLCPLVRSIARGLVGPGAHCGGANTRDPRDGHPAKVGRARFRTMLSSGASASDASRFGDASGDDDGNASDASASSADASAADAARALFVSAVEQDALSSLSRAAREAVAGATACVCAGLDGDGDAALEVLRLVVIDALALDEAHLDAARPLVTAPASEADLDRGVERARVAFVRPFSKASKEVWDGDAGVPSKTLRETIDWSVVVAALVVKTASLGRHEARVSSCFQRLTRAAGIPWLPVAAFEDLLARKLRSALDLSTGKTGTDEQADERTGAKPTRVCDSAPPPRRDWAGAAVAKTKRDAFGFSAMRAAARDMGYGRAAAVGAAAAVGGGLMFVTGGAAAPGVMASLASLSAAGGVLGAVALSAGTLVSSFGGATGIAYVLGGVGAGLTGWRTARRLEGLSQFAFLPLRGADSGMRVVLYVPGFLRDPGDLFKSFGKRDGVYSAVMEVPRRDDGETGAAFDRKAAAEAEAEAEEAEAEEAETNEDEPRPVDAVDAVEAADASRSARSPWRVLSDAVAFDYLVSKKSLSSFGADGARRGAGEAETAARREKKKKTSRDEAASEVFDVPSVGVSLTNAEDASGGARVASVVPGGVADAAGVVEGSVIVSAAVVRDGNETFDEETPFKTSAEGKNARAIAALFAHAERSGDGAKGARATRVELRLRRNLSRDADVDALARRRARRKNEAKPSPETETMAALDASRHPLLSESTARLGGRLDRGDAADENETKCGETSGASPDERRRARSSEEEEERAPRARLAWPLPRGEQFVVAWEHALLMDLGGAMSAFGRAAMTRYVGAQAVAHTSLAALASAVAWPVTLLNAGGFIDSPWALAEARSKDAGRALADALLEGSARGARRPVTIIAYSLGCDVARAACARLLEAEAEAAAARREATDAPSDASGAGEAFPDDASDAATTATTATISTTATTSRSEKEPREPLREPLRETSTGDPCLSGRGLIQDLVFVGAPLDTSFETWALLRRVAAGRVVNAGDFGDLALAPAGGGIPLLDAARGGDWMLRFLFRKKTWALRRGVAAWTRVDHPGVENVDVGEVSGAHVDIPDRMGAILRVVGLDA